MCVQNIRDNILHSFTFSNFLAYPNSPLLLVKYEDVMLMIGLWKIGNSLQFYISVNACDLSFLSFLLSILACIGMLFVDG